MHDTFELTGNFGKAPPLLRWDVVSRCNLHCAHCCSGEVMRDGGAADLDTEQLLRGLDNAARSGVRQVHLLGGEPTIRRDFLDIVRHARSIGLEVSFNTNGTRQGRRFLESLLALEPVGITVSIDGPDAEANDGVRGAGSFERACRFVEKVIALRQRRRPVRPEVQVQAVLTSSWADRAGDMVRLTARLGADALVVNHLAAMGDAIANRDRLEVDPIRTFEAGLSLLDAMGEHPELRVSAPIRLKVLQYHRLLTGDRTVRPRPKFCPALDENSHVLHDGTLVPCQLAWSQGLGATSTPPNVLDDDLEAGWRSTVFRTFAEHVKRDLASVYRHQVPCNRCIFLGRGCVPCPLPARPGLETTNLQCLIADALIEAGRRHGGVDTLPDDDRRRVMTGVVERNPPRPRPHGSGRADDDPLRRRNTADHA